MLICRLKSSYHPSTHIPIHKNNEVDDDKNEISINKDNVDGGNDNNGEYYNNISDENLILNQGNMSTKEKKLCLLSKKLR